MLTSLYLIGKLLVPVPPTPLASLIWARFRRTRSKEHEKLTFLFTLFLFLLFQRFRFLPFAGEQTSRGPVTGRRFEYGRHLEIDQPTQVAGLVVAAVPVVVVTLMMMMMIVIMVISLRIGRLVGNGRRPLRLPLWRGRRRGRR